MFRSNIKYQVRAMVLRDCVHTTACSNLHSSVGQHSKCQPCGYPYLPASRGSFTPRFKKICLFGILKRQWLSDSGILYTQVTAVISVPEAYPGRKAC
jgi:hypothetical protein